MRTFKRQGKPGVDGIMLSNVYSEESFQHAAKPSVLDVLWIYGKVLEISNFPSWQGFMETATSTMPYVTSQIIALPFINHPPTNYDTVFTVICHAAEETKKMGQTTCLVTFDQPLYMKAKDIVAAHAENSSSALANVIVRLGGFHLLMSYLGSIGYIMGGSGLAELWSTVFAPSSVQHMLSGHAYARAIRAHLLTYCALSTMMIQNIPVENTDKEHLKQILCDFGTSPLNVDAVQDDIVIEKLQQQLSQYISELRETGKTTQLWVQYHELVTLAMHFIQAERMGNWDLHVQCVRAMLPIFHASGHFLYAKSCQLYLQDMDSLRIKMPREEFYKFTDQSFFTIRRSEKHWCGVWSDMTIEQTLMKNMKSVGGITHGRGFTDSVLNKWIFGLPVAYHICENMAKFCGIKTSSSYQHVELGDSRIKQDEEACKTFILWLEEHSPFADTKELVSLSSGVVATADINCHKATSIGKESLNGILKNGITFGTLKLKRLNRVKPISDMNSAVKVADDIIQVDTTQLFQRIICTVHLTKDLRPCFGYELATVPLSLFDEKGLMRKTKKSSLYQIFDTIPERTVIPTNRNFVIDGGYLIHRVVWPKAGTFSDVYIAYVQFIQNHYGTNVTVVFGGYSNNASSTKGVERQQRLLRRASPEIAFNENTVLSDPQDRLLNNLANKTRLIAALVKTFSNEGIEAIIATDDADVLIVQTAIEKSAYAETVVVVGQDVDFLVLAIGLSPDEADILFLKEAQGSVKEKFYSSRDIRNSNILKDCRESILFAHAISGCDTTSAFFGSGKCKTINLLRNSSNLQDIVSVFNNPNSTQDQVAEAGERYILTLYKAADGEKDLNHHRFICFNKSVGHSNNTVLLSRLPPTSAAGRQHSFRVYHQIQSWRGETLQPEQWGWRKISETLSPVYTTEPPAPASILKLISCACKLGCNKRCGCAKAGLRCSTMCSNCRGQGCTNATILEDDIDDAMTIT